MFWIILILIIGLYLIIRQQRRHHEEFERRLNMTEGEKQEEAFIKNLSPEERESYFEMKAMSDLNKK
ncbi:MAG: hypothetical protein ABH826_04425 [Patescibacteria group bacterium]|nr:hypothetical protein [Patescibacteria group bacterium]